MKNILRNSASFAALALLLSCNQTKKEESVPEPAAVEQTAPAAEPEAAPQVTETVSGKITAIQSGKDGYTATLETADKKVFFATISHSNLTKHEQYKTVVVGDTITVKGDLWQSGEESHITVRAIL